MSRILVFDQNGNSVGEVHGICNRGWSINGGGETTISLSNTEALHPWLQFGNIMYVEHPDLPTWAGVLDTPWKATSPVQLTVYDISYLLHLRSPEAPLILRGTTGGVASKIIELANQLGDLRIRTGLIDANDFERDEKFEVKTYWEMLKDLVTRTGYEMMFRVERDTDRRLIAYLDMSKAVGYDDPLVLSDGQNGNMQMSEVSVDGEIWNRVLGMSDESTFTSRKRTAPLEDSVSIGKYGLRNIVKTFTGILNQTALDTAAYIFRTDAGNPNMKLTVNVLDRQNTFSGLRIGNRVNLRATKAILPGGKQGWNGIGRITSMFYTESSNTVAVSFEGEL